MAMARKCDRCGMFYTENRKNPKLNYIAKGVAILKAGYNLNCPTDFDLCDSCMSDFISFIYDYEAPTPVEPTEPIKPSEPENPDTGEEEDRKDPKPEGPPELDETEEGEGENND